MIFTTGDPHIAKVLNATMRTTCLAKPFSKEELREGAVPISIRALGSALDAICSTLEPSATTA